MGQHKNNPKSQLKKEGKLPPKPIPMGAPERRRRLQEIVDMKLTELMLIEGAKSAKIKREDRIAKERGNTVIDRSSTDES